MFTGIVEEIGTVQKLLFDQEVELWDGSKGQGTVLTVKCSTALDGAYIGCSIAINGTCLTVVRFDGASFDVNLAAETLRRTNLGSLREGDGVNLERAMAANARNSGHMVQGHVDGTGTVASRRFDGDSLWIVVQAPADIMQYIVAKGFIAIDGTSLTVCDVDRNANTFSFMLIPHTQAMVVLPQRQVGHHVNLEVDVVSKYVNSSMASLQARVTAFEAKLGESSQAQPASAWVPPAPATAQPIEHQGIVPGLNTATSAKDSTTQDEEIQEIKRQGKTVHGEGLEVPLPTPELAKQLRIGIAYTCWHSELITVMLDKTRAKLLEGGAVKENIIEVACPGSFELPYVAGRLVDLHAVDVVICIGILIKGGTIHMEVIANAVTNSLMELQHTKRVPVIFGVLTVLSLAQAQERAHSSLGASWGNTALCMANYKTAATLKGDE
eukprot:m.24505 g.24505  ORF g.24505 m.24505 type:complete len:439 (-) comp11521_c0_seq1:64-1380(-)